MYKRIDLSEIMVRTANKKAETITIQCQNCGKDKEVEHYVVWRKYCDMACYKEALEEKKRINRILNA